eukprot:PhF_6_TR34587/c0_g1_i1/m.50368
MDVYLRALTATPTVPRAHHLDISTVSFLTKMKVDVPFFVEQASALAELSFAGMNHCQSTFECKSEHRTLPVHFTRAVVQFEKVLEKYGLKNILGGPVVPNAFQE